MSWYKLAQSGYTQQMDARYPIASGIVDGRQVRGGVVPNTDSISASLSEYQVLRDIREVPMSEFVLSGKHYSVQGTQQIKELQKQIEASGEITPLIVVIDKDGPYILEGATRAEALFNIGAKSFPAMVVIDEENSQEASDELV